MSTTFSDLFLTGSKKLLWTARGIFVAIVISIVTDSLVFGLDKENQFAIGVTFAALAFSACIAVIVLDVRAKDKDMATLSAVYFGLLLGYFIGSGFAAAVQPLINAYFAERLPLPGQIVRLEKMVALLMIVSSCYIVVSTLIQTKDEFRFIIPYVEFSKDLKGAKPLVLDTSVIIDGRIADICDTGIIDTKLIVPRFVLQELQGIADSSDKIRRNRGRRGLDVLKKLQSNEKIELQMSEANLPELREVQKVDERLVIFAKSMSARLVTNDFNLNKICQLQGVDVINLNELSNALKLVALPGEILLVKITKQGDQIGQGVGYLDDGTMVVVEQGRNAIGHETPIIVTSVLQSPAGRMIFGRLGGTGEHPVLN